ncbi:sodium-coupled monocarboxylate transporter 2-like [Haemaphysalis longicornis]
MMMQTLEYVVFGTVVTANIFLGLYYSFRKAPPRNSTSSATAEVFLGSRRLRMLPLAASCVASVFSSTGLVAFPAHYYAYGLNMAWAGLTPLFYLPLATQVVVPVLYKLGVTSIFQYIRLRFNNIISLTACAIYIVLTQSVGAVSIFAASLTLVTVFGAPLFWCNICIGLCGTIYTTLGGLRGVVWTDCLQLLIIIIAPTTIIIKILVDSLSDNARVQHLTDLNYKEYMADFSLDLTNDENVWTCLFGASALAIFRLCFDQVVVQRQMACRTLEEAKRTTINGSLMLFLVYTVACALAFALIIWFRGCDPGLLGEIKTIDQILPYYITKYLVDIPGLSGLFLAGVVSAATSTVSSIINSQAAILYIDVISPLYKMAEAQALSITRGTALVAGLTMTAYSSICVYLGSLTGVFMMAYAACAAPFVGMCLLAFLFPFVHSKGAGTATLLVAVYEIYHMVQTITSRRKPRRMPVSLKFCPTNLSSIASAANDTYSEPITRSTEGFFLLRLSFFWTSFFGIITVVLAGILISAITGELRTKKEQRHLSSDALMRIWQKCCPEMVTDNAEEATEIRGKKVSPLTKLENTNLLMRDVETEA